MIRDCRADRPEGWLYFISNYAPAVRWLLTHYLPASPGENLFERVLVALRQPQSSLFASREPAPERWFVAELRQQMLALAEEFEAGPEPEIFVDLETLSAALVPL